MIKLICIGKTQHDYVKTGLEVFYKRINQYARFEIVTIPDIKNTKNKDQETRKNEEASLFESFFTQQTYHILLDEKGTQSDSLKFAYKLEQIQNQGFKHIHFYIGGPYGFSQSIRGKASWTMSLSPMTFNHELVRLIFTEQLYRAYTIINNEPYHHG